MFKGAVSGCVGGKRPGDSETGDAETRRWNCQADGRTPLSAFCFLLFRDLGRLGTALGRLWDGSKKPESPMIARLGTVGRLGQGVCMGMPKILNSLLIGLMLHLLHQCCIWRIAQIPNVYGDCCTVAPERKYGLGRPASDFGAVKNRTHSTLSNSNLADVQKEPTYK